MPNGRRKPCIKIIQAGALSDVFLKLFWHRVGTSSAWQSSFEMNEFRNFVESLFKGMWMSHHKG